MCAQRCTNAVEHGSEIPVRLPAANLVLDALLVVCLVDSAPVGENLVAQHERCLVEDRDIDRAAQECLKVRHSFQAIEGMVSEIVVSTQQERHIHIAAGGGAIPCHRTKEVPGDNLGALGQAALQNAGDSLAREWFAGPASVVLSLDPLRLHSPQYRSANAQVKPVRKNGEHDCWPLRR